uniref:Mitochondrial resolvase Ydc2 catalytic domain-containing protein n=1 Tax=viral metagenome TaxID=1070528 RepID=A0A6C0KMG6_9ZZZZ
MKILSFDIGIKNLSFCLFEIQNPEDKTNQIKILKWDNIDLSERLESKCIEIDKNGLCNKPAKFRKEGSCYCLKHSKKQHYLLPTKELSMTFLNKQKMQSVIDIADKYKIKYENPPKKANLIGIITEFSNTNCFSEIQKSNASKIDLVTIGKNIQHKFDEILVEHISTIDNIIIENQIGPIANKMKTIQGMISQYFIMKNNNINIEFISAANKLKDFLPKDNKEKTDYKQRKKLGIQTCLEIINNDFRFKEWENFFNKHTKKDDLSDCFLQGMWFIKHKL